MEAILEAIRSTLHEEGYESTFDSRLIPARLLLPHNGETLSIHVDDATLVLEQWCCNRTRVRPLFSRSLADPNVVDALTEAIRAHFRH